MILQARANTGVRRGTTGGPTASRKMIYSGRGELSLQRHLRPYPLFRGRFDFGTKTLDDANKVRDIFYVLFWSEDGPFDGFLVRDWNDYQLTQANSILVFISGSNWQICRLHRFGAYTYARPIYRPAYDGTTTIYRTRSGVVTVASASVDTETGIATISGHAGGDTYTAVGEFDIAVTFANDDDFAKVGLDGNPELILQAIGEVELVEVPPEPT
jgi:hypothetical protein